MWIYGRNPVLEALRQGQVLRLLLADGVKPGSVRELRREARGRDVPVEVVPRIDLDRALKTTGHQGVAAELPELEYAAPDAPFDRARERGERLLLVLLDHVQDPRNYGAIVRSAEALGAHGVVSEERRSAPLSAIAAKASAGAASHLPLVQVKNLPRYVQDLQQRDVWVYGADGAAKRIPGELDWERDLALVIGAEGAGLRRLVRDRCDELVAIPMQGRVGSLNASVAAGVLLYAAQEGRARTAAPAPSGGA